LLIKKLSVNPLTLGESLSTVTSSWSARNHLMVDPTAIVTKPGLNPAKVNSISMVPVSTLVVVLVGEDGSLVVVIGGVVLLGDTVVVLTGGVVVLVEIDVVPIQLASTSGVAMAMVAIPEIKLFFTSVPFSQVVSLF
jgi:hypothetical protein